MILYKVTNRNPFDQRLLQRRSVLASLHA